ncbi:MAG: anthranilate phosphoribosyltransferase [Verrucomicrobia subdivision 3 bacterium]|nr:anthranilate phosphoribosyltransferase [Limisphaerales bacterium]
MLNTLTEQLRAGTDLSGEQVTEAVQQMTAENVTAETKAKFLTALAAKGESTEELAAFAGELRGRATAVPLNDVTRAGEILDVCGTGGDGLNTFNLSTTVSILCAAAGVTVAKHGNRAITSQSGSADVLAALGIPTDLSPADAAASMDAHGFAFLFAPLYHPAFKNIAPARKLCAEAGQRTLFNFLGPLLNPARPTAQLIGVPRAGLTEPMAKVLQTLGIERGMVVCGSADGKPMDELSTLGENAIAEFYQDRGFSTSTLNPADLPLASATLADLAGGDAETNAGLIRSILSGEDQGPKREAVLLNAGAALFVANAAASISAGMELAAGVIDDGRAAAKLAALAN